jgi:guanylate kinase
MKREKVILVGPSGSGKDFLMRGLLKKDLNYAPKFTTRPKRKFENQGLEYDFITNDDFSKLLEEDKIKTYQKFLIGESIWYYGLTKETFDKTQLFVMTPFEINQLSEEDLKGCFVVYLDIDLATRRTRLIRREDQNDSVERRLAADAKDFANYNYYDLKITDPDFDADSIYDLMI